MRPDTFFRYALALAFVLAGSGWFTTAHAQARKATTPQPTVSTLDGSVQVFADQLPAFTQPATPNQRGEVPTLTVDAFTTGGAFGSGDPDNTIFQLDIGAGNEVTGVGWEVNIETFGASWQSESRFAITPDPDSTTGVFIAPGSALTEPGQNDFSSEGVLVLADAEIPNINAGDDGLLYFEYYESFDDGPGADAVQNNAMMPLVLPGGLRLECTDQAACDAAVGGSSGGDQASLPIDFEDENVDYELVDFGGNASQLIADPTDPMNTVVESVRTEAAECFAGTTVSNARGFAEPIPFAPGDTKMNVRVWSPQAGVRVLFKVEKFDDPTINVETFSFTTVAEQWETIEFDFANPMPNTNPINFENEYSKASIFFDFQCNLPPTGTTPSTYYWDDVAFGPAQMEVPDVSLNEFRIDQAGADDDEFFEITGEPGTSLDGLSLIVIGDGAGGQGVIENVTSLDGQAIPASGFFLAAEATFTLGTADFTTDFNFENGQSSTFVLVSGFSGMDGDDLDTDDDGTPDVAPWAEIVDVVATVSGAPDDIAYGAALGGVDIGPDGDFAPAMIYRAADTGNWIVGAFDLGVDDTPGAMNPNEPATGGDQASLPIDFEDENVDYELVDFGGNASQLIADPTDPMNTVVESVRTEAAECFAGTTVSNARGFAEPIPFAPGDTKMNVRVWSPQAGVRVLFKVEKFDDPTINVETFSFTTVAEQWETIEFDFANPMPNTNPINFENEYSKASIFFDFQCNLPPTGTTPSTYYWDDVAFGPAGNGGGDISFSPSPLLEMLNVGETGTETVTITNNTDGDVAFDFSQYSGDVRIGAPAYEDTFKYLSLAKGEDDPRVGEGQRFGSGGPDAFGYQWIDSNEPGGPAFDWVDISETGTALDLGDDDSETVALPFTFSFYGQDKSEVSIGSNGYITFGADGTDFSNDPIPTDTDPNDFIAPFWDDQDPGDGVGTVYWQDLGDGRFVVQYEGLPPFPGPGDGSTLYTYQVILNASGSILFQYEDMIGAVDGATIGIENADATDGLQVAFNEAYVENGLAVLIQARPAFVTGVTPATGVISAGGTADVAVDFSAEGLNGGTFEGNLVVDTDLASDPSTFELPVVLEVAGMAACAITPDPIAFEDTIVGFSTSEEATVSNGGSDSCELTAASAEAPFSVEGFEATTLAPGGSTTFSVVYTPTAAGAASGTLTVSSPEGDLTAGLEGTGLEPPSFSVDPTSLDFEDVETGSISDAQTLTLTNSGAGAGSFSISVANATRRGLTPALDQIDPVLTLNAPETAALLAQIEDKPIVNARSGVTVTAKPGSSKLTATTQESMLRGGGPGDLIASTTTIASISGFGQTPDGTLYVCDLNAGATTETFTFDGSAFTSTGTFTQPGTPGTNITGCTYFPDGDSGNGAIWFLNADLAAGTASFIETDFAGTPTGAVVPVTGLPAGAVPIGLSYNEATGQFFLLDIAGDDILSIGTDGAVTASVPQTCLDDGSGVFGNALDALGGALDVAAGTSADARPTRVQVTEFDGSCRGDGQGNDLFTPISVTTDAFINAVLRDRSAPNEVMYIGANSDFTVYGVVPAERDDIGSFLVIEPQEGTVDAGGDQEISVSVDATNLEPGTYTADLVIESNDPANPALTVAVTVEVVPVVSNEEDGVPTEFALGQNYPNPFASRTTIDYALPEAARVTITVYDAVGRRVAVLVDEDVTSGYHTADWDTRGLASGVYLYRIQAGDFVKTKKMSLVR